VSIEQHIPILAQLAEADATAKVLEGKIDQECGEIDGVRVEVAGLVERLEIDRVSIQEMEKTRGDLVQELRQISGQIDRSRERLQRARNEREVNAAERELDELRKLQRDRDDEIKRLITLADSARESTQEAEQRKAELDARLEGSLEGSTKSIAELKASLSVAHEARQGAAKQLPSLVLRRYESMHQRGKVPIAKTHDGTCLGCYVKLPPMIFHTMLSRREFEECPTCHRIIYYEPPPSPDEQQEADEDGAADEASSEASS
jgi:predicted  nucleic acid-binding Zn-ribbon protein